MKFKVGEVRPKKDDEKTVVKESGILLQSQSGPGSGMSPKFGLAWRLEYADGFYTQSEWTPKTEPSIRRALAARPDVDTLTVIGMHRHGSFELNLAHVDYSLVADFGYIGEQSSGLPGIQAVLGIYVNLRSGNSIKIWRNGFVQEIFV